MHIQKEKVVQKKNDSQKEEGDLKRRQSGKEGGDFGYWKHTGSERRPWRSEPMVWVRDMVARRTKPTAGVGLEGLRDRDVLQKQFSHNNMFILTSKPLPPEKGNSEHLHSQDPTGHSALFLEQQQLPARNGSGDGAPHWGREQATL